MGLLFRKAKPGYASKDIRRDSQVNFEADTDPGYDITLTVTFIDFNKQTDTYTFDIIATDAADAVTKTTGTILPALAKGATTQLQGMQILAYSLNINQQVGDTGAAPTNPVPGYGHQREMYGVLEFPIGGKIVEVKFPTPTIEVLLTTDPKYLQINQAAGALKDWIDLYTGATPVLQVRGQKPSLPTGGYMRHDPSRVMKVEKRIG